MRRTTDVLIAACALAFIVVLAVAAYWDPTIRVLHVVEALPYLAAAILCLRRVRFGYPLGAVSGAFWLWTGGLLTTFVRNGFERLAMLIRTGHVDRPDILIAAPAGIACGGLLLFSLLGYVMTPAKSARDAALFGAALILVPAFFIAIFAAFAPQYLGMFRRLM
ncbi:MAG TPA: hypothetical protein VHU41_20975 [Thermoanaerobaculia bacterium]|jgi:hypothetical protein|nr:hypothetical protein [Thermoanaerobaculia bacterium]